MNELLPWLILLPLAWGTAAFLAGPSRGGLFACAALALQLVLAVQLAVEVGAGGLPGVAAGGWEAPLGITLQADGLTVLMLLLTHVVALPLAIFARGYFRRHAEGGAYFWPLAGYLVAAMNALYLSADIFNLYVTLELLGLAAVGLVAAPGKAGSLSAALRYLFATLLGSGAFLLGVALLYASYGTVSLALLAPLVGADAPLAVRLAAGLMLAGLLLKTALFPLHFWLPPAHGGALAPVSALLSALVVKATFYLLVRLWLDLFLPLALPGVGLLLGLLGSAAILWGSFMALRQHRLKLLIAYSTVAQIGYLFLFFPLAAGTPPHAAESALQGVFLQVLAHGLAKSAMFAAAGAMVLSIGHDDIHHLGGVSSRLPLTLYTFGIAGVTLMGLPPSGGFLAKWLLIDAAIISRQWLWIPVLIIGGLLSAAYVFKVLRHAFVHVEESAVFRPLPRGAEWPAFLLATASLALGIEASFLLELLATP